MAHIHKRDKSWRAEIDKHGVRRSATFPTKAAATAWATQIEADIVARKHGALEQCSMADALARYESDVSSKKRGHEWEKKRLVMFKAEPWAKKAIADITTDDLARWRDKRLQGVTSGAVRRDVTLLRHVFSVARKEWGLIRVSPFDGFTVPAENRARTRRIGWAEVRRIVRALGHRSRAVAETKSAQCALAFLLGLRTAMRAGELLSLTPQDVDLSQRVAHLSQTKNGDARDVPLSRAACRLFRQWRGWTVTSASLDALFRKARKAAGLSGFTFHDSRAEALTRMASKLDAFELARVSGHRDLKTLLARYYRATAAQIALKL